MSEKLLMKSKSTIWADEVVELLQSNNVSCRVHDETQNPAVGVYGPITGIAIYVLEKDYSRACELITPQLNEMDSFNKATTPRSGRYTTFIAILSIFLILLPAIYLVYAIKFDFGSTVINYIAVALIVIGIILSFFSNQRK